MTPSEFLYHLKKLPAGTPVTATHIAAILETIAPLLDQKPQTDFDSLPDSKLIDEEALAEWLGESPSSLQKWRLKGDGPKYVRMPKSVRYSVGSVRDWIASRTVKSTSEATVRGLSKLESVWNVQVTGKDIIPDLDRRIIQDELHIVLDWALDGLQRLYQRGHFEIPDAVQAAKQEAMAESNSVQDWVNAYGVAEADESGPFLDKGYLYGSYVKYCDANGYMACNLAQFFKRMKSIFPGMKEKKEVRGLGKERARVRCVNLTTGKFSDEEMQEIEKQEQAEIDAVFGGTGSQADDIVLMNHPSRKAR